MTKKKAFIKKFEGEGLFAASRAAEKWLCERRYSYGPGCASPCRRGILKGDYIIAKYRNLTRKEIKELDGEIYGDFRDGPVFVMLYDYCEQAELTMAGLAEAIDHIASQKCN